MTTRKIHRIQIGRAERPLILGYKIDQIALKPSLNHIFCVVRCTILLDDVIVIFVDASHVDEQYSAFCSVSLLFKSDRCADIPGQKVSRQKTQNHVESIMLVLPFFLGAFQTPCGDDTQDQLSKCCVCISWKYSDDLPIFVQNDFHYNDFNGRRDHILCTLLFGLFS